LNVASVVPCLWAVENDSWGFAPLNPNLGFGCFNLAVFRWGVGFEGLQQALQNTGDVVYGCLKSGLVYLGWLAKPLTLRKNFIAAARASSGEAGGSKLIEGGYFCT
jgi:hypothetical protein